MPWLISFSSGRHPELQPPRPIKGRGNWQWLDGRQDTVPRILRLRRQAWDY